MSFMALSMTGCDDDNPSAIQGIWYPTESNAEYAQISFGTNRAGSAEIYVDETTTETVRFSYEVDGDPKDSRGADLDMKGRTLDGRTVEEDFRAYVKNKKLTLVSEYGDIYELEKR